jgi:hypothetical protein
VFKYLSKAQGESMASKIISLGQYDKRTTVSIDSDLWDLYLSSFDLPYDPEREAISKIQWHFRLRSQSSAKSRDVRAFIYSKICRESIFKKSSLYGEKQKELDL